METMPPQTARGHQEPYTIQFSVFLANRVGQLRDMLQMFAKSAVRILGVSIIDSTDWAVIRLVTSDLATTRALLKTNALPFTESEIILVEVAGHESLSAICAHLLSAEINVHFAYTVTLRQHDNPVMAFHVDDRVLATQILLKHDFVLLGEADLME
jgi:hypothetical protein